MKTSKLSFVLFFILYFQCSEIKGLSIVYNNHINDSIINNEVSNDYKISGNDLSGGFQNKVKRSKSLSIRSLKWYINSLNNFSTNSSEKLNRNMKILKILMKHYELSRLRNSLLLNSEN